jgi:hypothetical protein
MRNFYLSRRLFVAGSLASPLLAFPSAIAQDKPVDPATLKAGEFQWHPDRSPHGPVVVLVSIPKQWRRGAHRRIDLLHRSNGTFNSGRCLRHPAERSASSFIDL